VYLQTIFRHSNLVFSSARGDLSSQCLASSALQGWLHRQQGGDPLIVDSYHHFLSVHWQHHPYNGSCNIVEPIVLLSDVVRCWVRFEFIESFMIQQWTNNNGECWITLCRIRKVIQRLSSVAYKRKPDYRTLWFLIESNWNTLFSCERSGADCSKLD
jgi:hypothetical protein